MRAVKMFFDKGTKNNESSNYSTGRLSNEHLFNADELVSVEVLANGDCHLSFTCGRGHWLRRWGQNYPYPYTTK